MIPTIQRLYLCLKAGEEFLENIFHCLQSSSVFQQLEFFFSMKHFNVTRQFTCRRQRSMNNGGKITLRNV